MHVDTDSQKLKADQKIFLLGMVKNGCGQSGHRNPKLTVSQKWTDGINRFFPCWYKFRKVKSWFNNFYLGIVKNGHGLSVHETLKSALSWEGIYELSWFFNADSDAIVSGKTDILRFHL